MKKMNDNIIGKLKELIDENGYNYLTDKPLAVNKELEEADLNEIITAGAILMFLVCYIGGYKTYRGQRRIIRKDTEKMWLQ